MEVRSSPYRAGKYYLGYAKQILAVAQLGAPLHICSPKQWIALQPEHRVMSEHSPYKRTYGLPILSVRVVRPMSFMHPHGAITIVKYRE